MTRRLPRFACIAIAAVAGLLVAPGAVLGHTVQHAGAYSLEIGWQHEPTYVGDPNAVSVTITNVTGHPVTDLGPDDLKVVVTTAGIPSPDLSFEPGFDLEEMEGPLGEYDAALVPTAPGDYTFHISGTIHGQAVDITVTSGDETFDPVRETSNLQFPSKLPSAAEVATHLDRVDGRVATLQDSTSQYGAAITAAQTAAAAAQAAADRALLVGSVLGGLGIVVGALGLLAARRAGRPRA